MARFKARPVTPATDAAIPQEEQEAAWGHPTRGEPRYQASIAVILAVVLYVTLPAQLTIGPKWMLPLLEGLLLFPVWISAPYRRATEAHWERFVAIALIAVINIVNVASLVQLVYLLTKGHAESGQALILYAIQIWTTNLLVFGLWYWELDRGGPAERTSEHHREPDFLFPQMVTPGCAAPNWTPSFIDYLYVSFTNASAFSPTDTMPLTEWAKMLMMIQALASLVTIALVAARAVNILGA
jgi:hypothetical protein